MIKAVRNLIPLLAAWLFAVLYIASNQFVDPDLWGRLSMGALYFQTGRFPYHDVFSYTAPHSLWVDHEWLTGLVFYQILQHTGEPGFLAFKYLLILAMVALIVYLYRACYKMPAALAMVAMAVTVGIYSVGLYATLRSHVFSFLLILVFLVVLELVRLKLKSKKWLGLLIPIGILWGNLHGGFIMGLMLLAVYGLGEALQTRSFKTAFPYWGVALAIAVLLGWINPYGWDYWRFLVTAWTWDRSHIGEWSAFRLDWWFYLPVQVLMMLLGVFMLVREWLALRKPELAEGLRFSATLTPSLVTLILIAMVLKGVRFQPFLALVGVAYLPVLFPAGFWRLLIPEILRQWLQSQKSVFQKTLPGLLLVVAVGGLVFLQTSDVDLLHVTFDDELNLNPHVQIRYPLAPIACLRDSPWHGDIVVPFELGELMYWALFPRFRVSMDGRYEEVYSQQEFLGNHRFYDDKEPFLSQAAFSDVDHSPADFILTEPKAPSTALLVKNPDWKLLNGNDYYLLYGRVASLRRMPTFKPRGSYIPFHNFTIQDFFTASDLRRFSDARP